MSQWVFRGLTRRVTTTRYPARHETAAGVSPGLPAGGAGPEAVDLCPTRALAAAADGRVELDARRCVHCFRCVREAATPAAWRDGYEWSRAAAGAHQPPELAPPFRKSVHVLVMDAGDCGACLHEVKQLLNPYYNMHRLGFFLTPSPRHADVLIVVGPGVDHLRHALERTYQAIPEPKRVVAVGACALSGGVFGSSFVSAAGVGGIVPVDVEVPGHPPPPLAILHGLLVATGRKPPATAAPAVEVAETRP